jgi:hypothetical protein
LAGSLQEERQNLKGLLLEPDLRAVSAEFASPEVNLEKAELHDRVWLGLWQ